MAGRKPDPNTRYRVYIHNDKKYKYAAVQMPYEDKVTNKIKYKVFHIGTIDNNYIFIPNLNFRHLDNEEKKKYIFPDMWDISKAILDMNSENDTDFNSELKIVKTLNLQIQ